MVHISEMAPFRVERVSDIIKNGMVVPVKIIKVDQEQGKISLSIKEADSGFFETLMENDNKLKNKNVETYTADMVKAIESDKGD